MPVLTNPEFQKAVRHIESMLKPAGSKGVLATVVRDTANTNGITDWKLREAKDFLQVESVKESEKPHGQWWWHLPPDRSPVELPPSDGGGNAAGSATAMPSEPINPEQVRLWAIHSGIPLSRYGPLPPGLIERYTRWLETGATTGPGKRQRQVFYQSFCPECDMPTHVLVRQMETRKQTMITHDASGNDVHVSRTILVGECENRSVICNACKLKKVSKRAEWIKRHLEDLENEKIRLADTPSVLSIERRITELSNELAHVERFLP